MKPKQRTEFESKEALGINRQIIFEIENGYLNIMTRQLDKVSYEKRIVLSYSEVTKLIEFLKESRDNE